VSRAVAMMVRLNAKLRWLLLVGGFFLSLASFAQTANQPMVVTISVASPIVKNTADNYSVKAGSDLFIKVRLTNTSQRDLVIGDGYDSRVGVDTFYNHYEIRDSSGNIVPMRTINHPELGRTTHGWPGRVLKPGDAMDVDEDRITGLYDLSRAGKYTIQDQRAVSEKKEDGRVKSNIITVTVSE
jgi:hypothetical protein